MLALLEPKVSSGPIIPRISKYSKFTRSVCAEAVEFVGGIWLLWDDTEIDVEVAAVDAQAITVLVQCHGKFSCVASVVYASPHPLLRTFLWDYLRSLSLVIMAPWFLIGDWNQVTHQDDKWGGRPVSSLTPNLLWALVSSCAWVDLGFSGSRFTWTNMRASSGCIRECLDRVWCNVMW